MIPQDIIQQTKKQHNLVEYVQSRGIQLKRKGHEYLGLCPFHDDHNPSFSINPSTNLWFCFACDMGGDVIKFVELFDKVSFDKAIKILGGEGSPTGDPLNGTAESVHGGALSRPVLLRQVFDFYCRTFKEDQHGVEYLQSRNLTDPQLFKTFRIGFANSSLIKTLNAEQKKELKQIGILTRSGREFFQDCVIFPLTDPQGNLINLYGRHISKPQHLYLPGDLNGLFYAPKDSEEIIITEGIIDALTLRQAGFHNVLPIYGVNGLTDNHSAFIQSQRINKVTLCLDADETGRNAEPKLKEKLESLGVTVSAIHLPNGLDINDFFRSHSKDDFEQLLLNPPAGVLTPHQQETPEKGKPSEQPTPVGAQVIDGGYIFNFDQRKYRTLGMNLHGLDRLKVNVKISKNSLSQPDGRRGASGGVSFHIDTLDLYSSRARANFIETSAKLLSAEESEITQEVNRLIDLLEDKRLEIISGNQEEKKPEMTAAEKEEALRFLKNPDLLNEIQSDFDKCGYIGEETARLFGYLSSVSRYLKSPLGLLIVSRSAAGKSFLQDVISRFVAPEDLQRYTRITGQSLFYKEQDALKNKVLAIAEEKGAEDAIYSIRTLQSDQYLTVAVTITDPNSGQKRTEEYQVEGPVVIIITTTNPEALDFETRNRFVILTIDESREQTRKILQRQREADSLEGLIQHNEEERIYKKHHNAQRLLRPLQVVNPFHNELTYPDNQLLMRREQKKYLTLIKTIAFLRQYQRKIKTISNNGAKIEYIEVTLDDIELANKLACDILGRSLDELSPHTRSLLKEIKAMADEQKKRQCLPRDGGEYRFTRREICQATGWSYWQIRPHLEQLTEMEYLYLHNGKQGQRHSYELMWDGQGESGEKFMFNLIDVQTLRKSAKTLRTK